MRQDWHGPLESRIRGDIADTTVRLTRLAINRPEKLDPALVPSGWLDRHICAEAIGPAVLARLRSMAAQLTIESGFSATRTRAVADREFDFVITSDECCRA